MKYLAACCTVKNEASHILEWMSFHRAVGFEHLVIIDHASTDGTSDVVASFPDQESVTLIRWDRPGSQMDMMNSILLSHRDAFRWCAFIDADEFLYSVGPPDVRNLLTEYEEFGAVGVHWHIYGSSGHDVRPKGLTIEQYTRRAPDEFIMNRHVKSIVKLQSAYNAVTSHLFDTQDGTVDENFSPLALQAPHGFFEHKVASYNRIRLNHYHTRSREDYNAKAARGFFGTDDAKLASMERRTAMFELHDRNEVEDRSALQYEPLTRVYMSFATSASISNP